MTIMKAGQLGRITSKCHVPFLVDKIVQVTTPAVIESLLAGEFLWNIAEPIKYSWFCTGCNEPHELELVRAPDSWLQPIAGDQPGEDETLKWAPTPAKPEVVEISVIAIPV